MLHLRVLPLLANVRSRQLREGAVEGCSAAPSLPIGYNPERGGVAQTVRASDS